MREEEEEEEPSVEFVFNRAASAVADAVSFDDDDDEERSLVLVKTNCSIFEMTSSGRTPLQLSTVPRLSMMVEAPGLLPKMPVSSILRLSMAEVESRGVVEGKEEVVVV